MSRNKRRRGSSQNRTQNQQNAQPKIIRLPLIGKDGFVNHVAFLGEASELQSASNYERNTITRDQELLTILYRENWIAKRIIDTPCEDMTRSWYTLASSLDQDKMDELAQLEAKHNVKQEITNGLRWARLYGGAAAVVVIKGQEDMLDKPLEYDDLVPGCFRGLIIVDKTSGLEPSLELEEDMDDPEFGYPKYYSVRIEGSDTSYIRVHHSRLLLFRGRMLPVMEEVAENYWGASELEHVYEELQKRNATSANIAQLVFQANVGVLKMADFGEIMGMGTELQKEQVIENIYAQNRIRNSFGMMIMGNEDGYEQHPYSFSGLSEVYESFMMDMAGAAEIPATKLYGRSPQGMNATGESDMKNYYEMLAQLQERNLRPAIEKLLPIMCMSLWGEIPDDIKVVFEPLQVTTPAERAQITQQITGVVIQAYSAGLISQQTALIELQKSGKDIGSWGAITDEIIESAETEVDSGEEMQDPMGGMGGMMPPGGVPEAMPEDGGMMSEEQPEAEKPEKKPDAAQKLQEAPEPAPGDSDEEALAKILRQAKGAKKPEEEEPEQGQDGGPGSGNFNHPGYRRGGGLAPQGGENEGKGQRKAGLMERAAFIANPAASLPEQKRQYHGMTGTKAEVARNNRERNEWADLTTHQRIKGNSEQQKHMAKMKAQVIKAAAKGDLEKAKRIVRQNRQYWANDPESAMKVQSETLKRQKAVRPRRFMHDAIVALLKMFARDAEVEDAEKPDTGWRTTEEGNHYKINTSTGTVEAGFGGKFTGKKLGEQWTPTSGSRQSAKGGKVAAPPKVAPSKPTGSKVEMTFNGSTNGYERLPETAKAYKEGFDKAKKNAEKVFSNPSPDINEMDRALNGLMNKANNSDAWNKARQGEIPTTSEYGVLKMPKEWEYRLAPNEREVLSNIIAESSNETYPDEWLMENPEAFKLMLSLQAKMYGAEIEPDISAEMLEKYAGIERREEVPGQQSMFWGENVPNGESGQKETAKKQEPSAPAAAPAATPEKQNSTAPTREDMIGKLNSIAWEYSQYDPDYEGERKDLLKQWNDLIPEAEKLGISQKELRNLFENPDVDKAREYMDREENYETPVAKEEGIRYNVGGTTMAKVPAAQFHESFHKAKDAVASIRPQDSWRVDGSYSVADYEDMDCYSTPGGSCLAVHNGDIVSVCKHPEDKTVRGSDLLKLAIEKGGNKLDAFGGLYGFYIRNGFEPVSWCEFADKKGIRPDDWMRGRDRKEPVIFFKHTGRSYEEISREFGENRHKFVRRIKKSDDYFAAQKARDDSMEG